MTIERRFRRSLNQELQARRSLGLPEALLVLVLAVALAEATDWPAGLAPWLRYALWGLLSAGAYGLVVLAFAQVRARAQPFDHTVRLTEAGVEVRNNYSRQTSQYHWHEVERVAITPEHFEFRVAGHRQGETYLLRRARLSADEQAFVAEHLLEL